MEEDSWLLILSEVPSTPSMSGPGGDKNALFRVNYATQILCYVIVTPLVFLRIYVRWRWKRALGFDDGMKAASCS